MLIKRTAVALALAAAFLAVVPAWRLPQYRGSRRTREIRPYPRHFRRRRIRFVASYFTTGVAEPEMPIGSWALLMFHTVGNRLSPWMTMTVTITVNIGCGFIGGGVGLANPIAGIFVGVGCSSSIGA